ncbi:hypothetical protein L6452_04801 [Arctium lappa]|uniref:Uncharacterized protein n=1 Tax=Arctium lappa TaxID=4217 RepID=A0ACB9EEM6_ARCLA|nr:hypothetical protein L6452_04801 [Arctium lappa]
MALTANAMRASSPTRNSSSSWNDLADRVKSMLKDYPELRLTQGRKVLEIRPTIKWDKGKALKFLLEYLGYANSKDVLPIYIGDDRIDEDAFKDKDSVFWCLKYLKKLKPLILYKNCPRQVYTITPS